MTKGAAVAAGVAAAYVAPVAQRVAFGQTTPGSPPPVTPTPTGSQGCTPGFWKQSQHLDSWVPTGYAPSQTLESVFDVPDALGKDAVTLLAALDGAGGTDLIGAAEILLRAAVAAILNAAHPGIQYARTAASVIADVNAALATMDRDTMLALAAQLDTDNNAACPLS
jgi:hypothetical protein